jgi:porin
VNYTGEVLGNLTSGIKRRAIYDNLLELAIDGDLKTIAGLRGASFHINSYQVNGVGLSGCCVFNVLTASSIEARPSTWLFEAWFEQKLFSDMASLRIGQLAANTEFAISEYSQAYLNATFGWPNIFAANMPSTAPNYPLATPGVRLKLSPNNQTNLLVALFRSVRGRVHRITGDFRPIRNQFSSSRIRHCSWLKRNMLTIREKIRLAHLEASISVSGTIFGKFYNQQYGTGGLSLANPLSNGIPIT